METYSSHFISPNESKPAVSGGKNDLNNVRKLRWLLLFFCCGKEQLSQLHSVESIRWKQRRLLFLPSIYFLRAGLRNDNVELVCGFFLFTKSHLWTARCAASQSLGGGFGRLDKPNKQDRTGLKQTLLTSNLTWGALVSQIPHIEHKGWWSGLCFLQKIKSALLTGMLQHKHAAVR